ncbi:MAG TPA: type I methionyl aminopeptidase [Spirochaetia bacterium]|nr:type I methionyl aminopeptidase [Spirochaetia bacterium]
MDAEVSLKTSIDVARIRRACRVAEGCLRFLAGYVLPGVTTEALDALAARFLTTHKATSALRGYRGFPCCICTSVNNVAAHGIPSNRVLEDGDLVSLDITVNVDGWFGDAAWSFIVGAGSPDSRRLLRAAWKASVFGVMAAKAGNHFGDIGAAIQRAARDHGCSVIEDYVGHGIGRAMHEDPMVLNFGKAATGLRIVPGMVFTVEPMLNLGSREVHVSSDGWTLVTSDGSLSAQFEHTVAVFRDSTEVLTFSRGNLFDFPDLPPPLG